MNAEYTPMRVGREGWPPPQNAAPKKKEISIENDEAAHSTNEN